MEPSWSKCVHFAVPAPTLLPLVLMLNRSLNKSLFCPSTFCQFLGCSYPRTLWCPFLSGTCWSPSVPGTCWSPDLPGTCWYPCLPGPLVPIPPWDPLVPIPPWCLLLTPWVLLRSCLFREAFPGLCPSLPCPCHLPSHCPILFLPWDLFLLVSSTVSLCACLPPPRGLHSLTPGLL